MDAQGNREITDLQVPKRERVTRARSGERLAPLGSVNPVDESKPRPVPSASTHRLNSPMRMKWRVPVHPPVGGIMTKSPALVRSRRHSGFNWQNAKNSWSLIFSKREPRCRISGWDSVTIAAGLMRSPPLLVCTSHGIKAFEGYANNYEHMLSRFVLSRMTSLMTSLEEAERPR